MPRRSASRARTGCRSSSSISMPLAPSRRLCAARAASPGSSKHKKHNKWECGRGVMPADLNKLKQDLSRRMDGALETLRREFAGLRTGRASPALLEPVRVEAYGTEMPITQVGTIGV